jgi:glycosyltransferase involved in cell wall biosynthesis
MARKVLVVTNMYPEPDRPAWGTFIKSQVDSLERRGVEIDLLVIQGYRSKLEYLLAVPRLWRQCRKADYDLVHAHYGLSGLVARTQFRFPLLVSYCGDDLYGHAGPSGRPRRRGLLLVWMQRALARFVDRVIVKSRAMAALIPSVACDVVPNGVDMDRFRPISSERCREELGLEQEATYLLFPYSVGRPRKNFALLQAAIDSLERRHAIHCQPLVVDGVPNERVPLYMNAADVLVLTSFWEGSPNAVKEAMACNTRVVSVDVGDVAELTAGQTGCAICGFDPDEMADAIRRVLESREQPTMRARMNRLSTDAVAATVAGIYDAMAGAASH